MPNSMENVDTSGLEPGQHPKQPGIPPDTVVSLFLLLASSVLLLVGVSMATDLGWGLATLGGFWGLVGILMGFTS